MTHDEFLEALAADGTWHQPGLPWSAVSGKALLGADAESHARECVGCGALLAALSLAAAERQAAVPEAPAGYWDSFGSRLADRLPARPPARRPVARTRGLFLAAAAAVAGLLVVAAWTLHHGPDESTARAATAGPGDIIAAAPAAQVEAALESLAASPDDMEPDVLPHDADALSSQAGSLDDSFDAASRSAEDVEPLASLERELATLDEAAQHDLARKLREASS